MEQLRRDFLMRPIASTLIVVAWGAITWFQVVRGLRGFGFLLLLIIPFAMSYVIGRSRLSRETGTSGLRPALVASVLFPDLSLALLILADRAGKSAPGLARWEEFGLALLWIGSTNALCLAVGAFGWWLGRDSVYAEESSAPAG